MCVAMVVAAIRAASCISSVIHDSPGGRRSVAGRRNALVRKWTAATPAVKAFNNEGVPSCA